MESNNFFNNTKIAFKLKSNWGLLKSFLLFKFIKNQYLTKIGIKMVRFLIKYKAPISSFLIKRIIFNHFCGGENKKNCLPVIKNLYTCGVKSVLDYSIEGQNKEKDFNSIYYEIISNIDFSKENIEIPFVVFKPTSLGNMKIYEKVNKKLILNDEEKLLWNNIKNRFDGICKKAFEKNILVLIDAEESWIQDAVDILSEKMMKKYNKKKTIVYNTLQMYRWDRIDYLKKSYKKSINGNYFIGYKLVRGAYMEKERKRAKLMGYKDPIQIDKKSTDNDYNDALRYSIDHIDKISIYAGTHNEKSCTIIKNLLDNKKIDKNSNNIWIGQLYGMSDHITFMLGDLGYNATKYLPYGPLKETIPYLIRRAEENVSITGQTNRELDLIKKEIKRRLM